MNFMCIMLNTGSLSFIVFSFQKLKQNYLFGKFLFFFSLFIFFLSSPLVLSISIIFSICTHSQEYKGLKKNMYIYSKLPLLENIFINNMNSSKLIILTIKIITFIFQTINLPSNYSKLFMEIKRKT